jgi:hypothetical protein
MQARFCASSPRPLKVLINGEQVFSKENTIYVPALHRGRAWFNAELKDGANTIEVVFDDGAESEFFLATGSIYGCGQWLNDIERLKIQ